ncbi:MAG: ATP synthase F1 subunit delta [Dehalococcoidales bacterium]|nr:ATP synthase F1 subunit delta [Dehalococcoidales bacterium]
MGKKANARRYAQAVFEIALEKKALDRWQTDLDNIVAAVSEGDFLAALESPRITLEAKSGFLKKRLGAVNPLATNLMLLLISRSSIGIIGEIAKEYKNLLNAYRGIEEAEITTAIPIDADEQKKLADRLGALENAKVVVTTQVSPDILGGVVVRVGGKLLDGSTRNKLATLKRELETGERVK